MNATGKGLLGMLAFLGIGAQTGGQDLVPFPIPASMHAKSLIAAPAAGPITEGDRITIHNGHFVRRDGRVRMWGVNLCFGASFPTHAEAEIIAARLAAFGVNAVRFHHMDGRAFPNGIWDPADPMRLSAEALDRLDYFIDQLAGRGIYANLNLHVSRCHAQALALPDADRLPEGDKMVGLFTPAIVEAQKQHAHSLLTHLNRYRGKKYVEDPALAFVEISNENSLFMWNADAHLRNLPPYYAKALQDAFVAWLKDRYENTEKLRVAWASGSEPLGRDLLKNGDFSDFDTAASSANDWKVDLHDDCKAGITPLSKPRRAARVEIEKADPTNWHIQLAQSGIPVRGGHYYTLGFRARADQPRTVWVSVMQGHEPWKILGPGQEEKLTAEWRQYRLGFVAGESDDNARVSFSIGASTTAVEFAEVRLSTGGIEGLRKDESLESGKIAVSVDQETPVRGLDRMRFFAVTEKAFYDGMYAYIKKDLVCRALVTGTIVFGPLGLYTQSDMDYVDGHAYWQHPHFPGRPWDPENWIIEQKAMVDNPDSATLFGLAAQRLNGKPYNVSEYNHPAPNDFQAECVSLAAAFAAVQDWDGVWFFSYSHRTNDIEREDYNGFFDIDANPAKWGFMPAGAAIFKNAGVQSLIESRIFPMASSPQSVAELIRAQDKHGYNIFGAVAEREKVGWDSLFQNRLSVSLAGTRLVTGSKVKPGETPAAPIQWTADDGFTALSTGAWVRVARAGAAAGKTFLDLKKPAFAAVALTAMDGLPLDQSARILITACGRCENTDMGFSADRRTVGRNWGKAPVRIEPVEGSVVLPRLAQGKWECYTVGPDGFPTGQKPFDPAKPFALSAQNKTMWYLLVRN